MYGVHPRIGKLQLAIGESICISDTRKPGYRLPVVVPVLLNALGRSGSLALHSVRSKRPLTVPLEGVTMVPYAKTLAHRTCVRSRHFYNGNRLRRAKNSLPLGFRSKCASRGNRGYERREEYHLARLGSAARSKLRGIAATGSRRHKETDENKTSIVARVAVSINRMCGLDALAYMMSSRTWTTPSPPTPRIAAPRICFNSASTQILIRPCVSPFS